MKKIFLLMAIVALVLTGCQKDTTTGSYGGSNTNNYGSSNTNNASTNAP